MRVRNIELVSPPMSAQASPDFHSEPELEDNAIGDIPIIIETVVITMGLILAFPASIRASKVLIPVSFMALVLSTRRIAFLPTSPISMITPRIEKILNDFIVKARARRAPTMATGIENSTTNG